jgi:NADPH:quinone reductase-like Zn-dependent oxidoreductase
MQHTDMEPMSWLTLLERVYAQFNLQVAAVDGRIAQVGAMSGAKLDAGLDISLLINKRIRWERTRLRNRSSEYQSKLRDLLVDTALPRFVNGIFNVLIEREFSWNDIQEAHALMESNQSKGKIICKVD